MREIGDVQPWLCSKRHPKPPWAPPERGWAAQAPSGGPIKPGRTPGPERQWRSRSLAAGLRPGWARLKGRAAHPRSGGAPSKTPPCPQGAAPTSPFTPFGPAIATRRAGTRFRVARGRRSSRRPRARSRLCREGSNMSGVKMKVSGTGRANRDGSARPDKKPDARSSRHHPADRNGKMTGPRSDPLSGHPLRNACQERRGNAARRCCIRRRVVDLQCDSAPHRDLSYARR